ncbi:MAG: cupin domain-containing protein [Candidatus Promineifilaceae bacterium]|nr:cupin domain-containing protein [Candidatus Promineifilaceae bacterium]
MSTASLFHHKPLPPFSTLLAGPAPPDEIGFSSDKLQIWYNNADESWVGQGERPHRHERSDECFIVLRGTLTVQVEGRQVRVGPGEFCCFPAGVDHAIMAVETPAETLMIRAPAGQDKVYRP